jgi:cellulose synthase/poly-beta-1,6-N-acetylglucosamine synthase-like glycosyltransferase
MQNAAPIIPDRTLCGSQELNLECGSSGRTRTFTLSIVVPVYKEEGNIAMFIREVSSILSEITQDFEVIFALDPSPDQTEEMILRAREADTRIKLIRSHAVLANPWPRLPASSILGAMR